MPGGGFIVGLDLETGQEVWRFNTVAWPGEPGGNTWNDIPLEERSGGSVWVPGSYDPELDLVYFGLAPTYHTEPLLRSVDIEGVTNDALYTNSTVALRPETGELVWYFQHIANDQWDLDWVYERQLIEIELGGVTRKVVLTAGKMALYDALDAATGEYLFSMDMGLQNIVTAIDPETGAKTLSSIATPNAEETHLLCPFANGGRNWQSAAYNPDSKMLFLPIAEVCMNAGPTGQGGILSTGAGMEATAQTGHHWQLRGWEWPPFLLRSKVFPLGQWAQHSCKLLQLAKTTFSNQGYRPRTANFCRHLQKGTAGGFLQHSG
jgi:alcohol dehydrogenase (cytochrome c)